MADTSAIIDLLKHISLLKGGAAVNAERLAAYAEELEPFPDDVVRQALNRLKFTGGDFFPSLARIVAAMGETLELSGHILPPDAAWHLAERTCRRWQPETRPSVSSGNQLIDTAIREVGGPSAFRITDQTGLTILRGRFIAAYSVQRGLPEQIAWSLSNAVNTPQLISGLELPDREVTALAIEARLRGVGLPEIAERAQSGRTARAILLGGSGPESPHSLPAPSAPRTLSEAEREELRATTRQQLAEMSRRMRLPQSETQEEIIAAQIHRAGLRVVRWNDGTVVFDIDHRQELNDIDRDAPPTGVVHRDAQPQRATGES